MLWLFFVFPSILAVSLKIFSFTDLIFNQNYDFLNPRQLAPLNIEMADPRNINMINDSNFKFRELLVVDYMRCFIFIVFKCRISLPISFYHLKILYNFFSNFSLPYFILCLSKRNKK